MKKIKKIGISLIILILIIMNMTVSYGVKAAYTIEKGIAIILICNQALAYLVLFIYIMIKLLKELKNHDKTGKFKRISKNILTAIVIFIIFYIIGEVIYKYMGSPSSNSAVGGAFEYFWRTIYFCE